MGIGEVQIACPFHHVKIQWGGTFCEPGSRPSLDIRSARIIRTLILGFLAAITGRNALLFKPSSLICYRDGLNVLRKPFFKKYLKKTLLCVYVCVHTHICTFGGGVCLWACVLQSDSMLVEVRIALWSQGLGIELRWTGLCSKHVCLLSHPAFLRKLLRINLNWTGNLRRNHL